tara:strand:+ start:16846 stop:16989 length:144 start_codon:yes stop_codon:yes gene_type:complete
MMPLLCRGIFYNNKTLYFTEFEALKIIKYVKNIRNLPNTYVNIYFNA